MSLPVPAHAPLPLLCLPYAGSSAALVYREWQRHFPQWVQVLPVELAGHGRRMAEPFAANLQAAAQDVLVRNRARVQAGPYAIYGHSMGALLAYVLLAVIERAGMPAPVAVFLSGRKPPHLPVTQRLHDLDDSRFLDRIRALGGTPDAFFEHRELVDMFLPILRSDYGLIERWALPARPHITAADLVLLHSDQDPLAHPEEVAQWARYGSGRVCSHGFVGDHFFLNTHTAEICALITAHLTVQAGACAGP